MIFKALLFPPQSRDFAGLRWLNISLRSLHLVGMAGLAGNYLYLGALQALFDFWLLTLYSGLALMGLSLWSDGRWLLQLRGLVILGKLLLLGLLPWLDDLIEHGGAAGFVVIILLSAMIAHAPARVRYYLVVPVTAIGKL